MAAPIRRSTIKEKDRDKLYKQMMEPVKIENKSQLLEMVTAILGSTQDSHPVSVRTELLWTDDNTKQKMKTTVESPSRDMSFYKLLLDGMDAVKKKMETIEKIKEAISEAKKRDADLNPNLVVWDISKLRFNVDGLIEHRMGGKRHGFAVRWIIPEGTFEFDIYERRLFLVEDKKDDRDADPE